MSPCAGKPNLVLVPEHGDIAPDIVFALRSDRWFDEIGASYASVRAQPVLVAPRNKPWELL